MHIVHILTRFLKAGSEENTIQCALHQARRGHRVTILHGPEYDKRNYALISDFATAIEIPSLVHPLDPINDYRAVREIRRFLKMEAADIVHTHQSKAGVVGRIAARTAGTRWIIHGVHIVPFNNVGLAQRLIYLAAEHAAAASTHLFVHVSEGTKEAYRKNRIGRSTPHAVVRSGMPVERFQDAEMPDDWRNLLGLAAGEEKPRVILMMAALEARKRQIGFLNGFAATTAPGQPIKLVLAGEGPDRPMIEARVSALGLADRVKLLGHYPEPSKLVRMADLGVLASVREGLPRVVIQYLAGGLPVVVSPIDGIEEVVHDGQNGRVVTASDAETVAAEAVRILLDSGEYARLAAGARKSPVAEWSYESMHASLDAAYEHLPQFSAIMSRVPSGDSMAPSL